MLAPLVVSLGKDIFFSPTVKHAAAVAGWEVVFAPTLAALADRAPADRVKAIVVDLTPLDAEAIAATGAALKEAYPSAARIAFGPHVQVDSFSQAAAAGFHPVLAKGAVASTLPKIFSQL
jgi:hypothetical protein